MSITKKLVVTLEDDVATPSERIFIYKGDVGVDIIIELENFNYKIDSISEKNMINRIEAYFKTPQGIVKQYNDEVDVINGDRIKFSFSKNVINDMQIIGQYELQFHLFDKEDNRITIPSYYFYVKEPLHNTSEEQEYDESKVDYARADYSKVKDDIVLFEVSENGYIKTNWQSGDLITSAKLNKIETQLEINTNKINEIEPYDDTELNNSLNRLSERIDNLNIPTKTSELENDSDFATKTYVNTKITEASLGGEIDLSNYATKDDLNSKVDKIEGKGLSANDYTDEEKNKLNGIEEGANNYIHPTRHEASMIIEDNTHRFVTDEEKSGWDNKSDFDGNYNNLTNKPSVPTKTSELENDSDFVTNTELDSKGYLTEHQDISGKVDKVEGKSLISDTEIERLAKVNNYDDTEIKRKLNNKADLSDLHEHSNKEILDGITIEKITSWNNKSDFDGNYNNLTNKPSIPTKTSQLTNDSGFLTSIPSEYITETELEAKGYLTEHQDVSGLATKSELNSKVDKVNGKGLSTNDLTNTLKSNYDTAYTHSQTSHITTDNVNTAVANYVAEHKSELKGDKGDVGENGKDGADGLTTSISVNGATYTHTDGLITLPNYPTVPTKTSELTNDSGYATETYVETKIAEASLSGGEIDLSGYATKDDLNTKEDKVIGKGLSTNDLTDELKSNYDTAYTHSQSSHAPSDAQKNSDITKDEIEAKLIGDITTHTHNQYLTEHQDISGKADVSGQEFTGMITAPIMYAKDYFRTPSMVGEGDNTKYFHRLEFGHRSHDYWEFHEYGGIYNFYKNILGNNDSGVLIFTIRDSFIDCAGELRERGQRVYSPNNKPTANDLGITIPTVTNDLTNELKANYDTAYTHSQSSHAPSDAQKNSDITKDEIETKLIGDITSHVHSQYLTEHQDISNLATKDELNTKANSSDIPTSLPANGGNADTIDNFHIWKGTQAQYNAISSKDSNTIYIIVG